MRDYLAELKKQGNKINPNIELTPETVKQFLDQATTELSPYYKEKIGAIQQDLYKNLDDLQKQYEYNKKQEEGQFRTALGKSREERSGMGTIFSGARGAEEQQALETEQLRSDETTRKFAQQGASLAAETAKQIGTRNITGLEGYTLTAPRVSLAGAFGQGSPTSYASEGLRSYGTLTGEVPREQTTATQLRSKELEEAERSRRALDLYT